VRLDADGHGRDDQEGEDPDEQNSVQHPPHGHPRAPNSLCEPDASCLSSPSQTGRALPGTAVASRSGCVSPSAGRSDVRHGTHVWPGGAEAKVPNT
jgi:hypothetical protein